MTTSRGVTIAALCIGLGFVDKARAAGAMLTLNGVPALPGDYQPADIQSLVLNNGLLAITFGKDANGDFSATSVVKNGRELAHNLHGAQGRDVDEHRTFYLDAGAGRSHLVVDTVRVVRNSADLAHFAVIDSRTLHLEHHFIMLRGESGVHPYVIIKSPPGSFGGGEMRTMYRFDRGILDWAWTNERTGQQPTYAQLQAISEIGNVGDETWRLPDGSIYQKYDYCLYYATSPMWGHYGHGFGVFFIPVSLESAAGGPLRQDLAVHQDALILNYLSGGHLGGGGSATGVHGEKIHGPWFLYFNCGETPAAIIADAKKTAAAEQAKWPYPWMDEPLYPLQRTEVSGQLTITHGRSAAFAYVVLGQPSNPARDRFGPGGDAGRRSGAGAPGFRPPVPTGVLDRASVLYTQSGDYIFYAKADANGNFKLTHVRPGTYTLYAWETQGSIAQSFARDGIEVKGETLDLGAVEWDPPFHPHLIFRLGQTDRMAGEFKFGSEPRTNQWVKQIPTDLTFTIGQSNAARDWYYAQHAGIWRIDFDLAEVPPGHAYLTIPVAGGPGDVTVLVNRSEVGRVVHRDDASVRRAANRSGVYARFEFVFAASLLQVGKNTVSLRMNGSAGENNGIMYDAIVLETD